jgi:membrane-associated phospholipid phosphatase
MKALVHVVSQVISAVFSPVVLPILTYCTLVYIDPALTPARKWLIGTIACVCSSLAVSAYVVYLKVAGKVGSLDLDLREERTKPFIVGVSCYFLGFLALYTLNAPPLITWLMFSSLTTTLIVQLITRWWKVSIHATGISGTVTAWAFQFGSVVYPYFLLIPIVSASRVILHKHTTAQVIVGSLIGLLLTALQLRYLVTLAM